MSKKVLEEEEYIDSLSKIIARDFYPGLPQNDSVNLSLDQFQSKYTSQDNHSFNQIISKNNEERLAKIKPFYSQKLISSGDHRIEPLKNNLIFGPEGIDEIKPKFSKKTISHSNTRLQLEMPPPAFIPENPIKNQEFDLVPNTPSIAPGSVFDPSELLTWGSIEGTPIRVDETPGFKIPPTPVRDLIGKQLAEKAKKKSFRSSGRSSAAQRILSRSSPYIKSLNSNLG